MAKDKNPKWEKEIKVAKATQVAFEMEQQIARTIRQQAAKEGLTPSDQIRKLVGLSFSPPKRPRLTASLTAEDYTILGKKYNIDAEDKLAIKKKMIEELIKTIEE
jgi:hypothetical protein